jgi:hypothetical protein
MTFWGDRGAVGMAILDGIAWTMIRSAMPRFVLATHHGASGLGYWEIHPKRIEFLALRLAAFSHISNKARGLAALCAKYTD